MHELKSLRMCIRCVMDTSDPDIEFDEHGVCSHCRAFDDVISKSWFPNEEGARRLERILARIRAAGKGRDYDCVIGLSGGVDSSTLALRARDWDLRVLAVHVDAGWNTELAVHNIERIVKYCDFDLHTYVVDWAVMRDLQVAYLRSGVANQDVPQDHVFFASLYGEAVARKVKYVLTGGNIATESTFPDAWHGSAMDVRSLRDIHRRFGTRKLEDYPTIGFLTYYFVNPYIRRLKVVRPLDYLPYDRAAAISELSERVGFTDYGRKHGESQFTRFFQNYYLPVRFGYDKRKPHLSSMILSGLITRDEALATLAEPLYDPAELDADKRYVMKKLRLSEDELEELLHAPRREHRDYRNQLWMYGRMKRLQYLLERVTGRRLGAYG